MGTIHEALAYLAAHGYAVLFFWVGAEQMGAPVPAAPILLAAGVLSATGQLSLRGAFLVAVIACVVGDSTWYAVGKSKGTAVLKTLCRISLEPDSCVRRASEFIARRRGRALLVSKFIPGISAIAVPLTANSGVPLAQFILYDLAGIVLYAGAYLIAGYVLGGRIDRLELFAGTMKSAAAGFAVAGTVAILAWRVHQRRRFYSDLRMARIEPEAVLAMIEGGERPYIVDLRHPLDVLPDPRVIPGAMRMRPDEVAARHDEIPRDREIILYCT
ncbi:MAG: VTT domain-containing protein [Terriglobales bacterium]